ncbi:hypothetical protein VTO42DRAFT_1805 [Malbranchea cinnamomea]
MSSSRWLGQSRITSNRTRLSKLYLCPQCALVTRQYSSSPSIFLKRVDEAAEQRWRIGRRKFHNAKTLHFPSPSVLLDEKSRAAFQAELEREDDIYSYLIKWKENPTAPNIDPIRPPELRAAEGEEVNWVGNMLNEQLVHDPKEQFKAQLENPRHLRPTGYENTPFLRPGDMVLMKSPGTFSDGGLAVYVRTIDDQMQFYTSRGRWRAARPNEVNFALNERVSPSLLAPILPYFPTSSVEMAALPQFALEGGVPRPLGAPLMSRMMRFEREAREFYGKHASKLDDIYNFIAEEKNTLILTLGQVAEKALKVSANSLTNPAKYAIHKALQRQSFYIVPNLTPSAVESYRIRSKEESRAIDTVVTWVRKHQNERARGASGRTSFSNRSTFEDFVEKARRLVTESRKLRTPNMAFAVGPASRTAGRDGKSSDDAVFSKTPIETFSRGERMIINFLLHWILPPLQMNSGALKTTGSMILRATGLYDDYPLGPATGYLFLQELGVLAPWENIHLLSEQLELPGHGFSYQSDRLTKESNKICENLASDVLVDGMKDLRKDWGDLPVFCVDSAYTLEIDDGISIERDVNGPPGTFWVRVHVANPSAFIPPSHPFAQAAAHLKQSFYAPERVYPMLPPTITQSHFSLAPGRPTITISAKVNMVGDILETEIVNGRVNNVIYFTPESVQKLFGVDSGDAPLMDFVVGGNLAVKKRTEVHDQVPEEHQESFRVLQKLLAARRDRRVKKGGRDDPSVRRSTPLVSIGESALPSWSAEQQLESSQYLCDPTIKLSAHVVDPFEFVESTKSELVAHAMLLAGEAAAAWCKERGIPVVYSATALPPEDPSLAPRQAVKSSALSLATLPRAFASSKPTAHVALGMDQYTKCTSPLRRYADMLAHWQIEAFLRGEELPFTEKQIDAHIARSNWQIGLIERAQSRSRDFWICQLLHRALNFGETKLPETFQCLVVSELDPLSGQKNMEPKYIGSMLPFRMRCLLETHENMEDLQQGDLVDVKISSIDVYDTLITADVVRLVKRPAEALPVGVLLV